MTRAPTISPGPGPGLSGSLATHPSSLCCRPALVVAGPHSQRFTMIPLRTQAIIVLSLLLVLAAVAALYWPALNGGLHMDDAPNLAGLADVRDGSPAARFIFEGNAGPLGRPIALASFSLEADAWPDHPDVFLQTNILIHVLNGALLAWVFLVFARLRGTLDPAGAWAAVAGAALWLVIPLLASSSLFIIQRMTTLATTFMLLGLIGYLTARLQLARQTFWPLAGMSTALILGTLLAAFTKEHGILLPILILVVEATLLGGAIFRSNPVVRTWAWVFLVAPLAIALLYLVSQFPYSESLELRRGFNATERILTQSKILWHYLFVAFLPTPQQLVPFHDHIETAKSLWEPLTFLAVTAWAIVIGTSLLLSKRIPLLAFAVFWYLGAHLLESTVISLELYFQHRNYLAMAGPAYALAAIAWSADWRRPAAARAILIAYIGILSVSLFDHTKLWGNPFLAKEMWAIHQPESLRAQVDLAADLHAHGYHKAALRVLDETHAREPALRSTVGIQALTLACAMHPDQDHSSRVTALSEQLGYAGFRITVPETLFSLYELIQEEECGGVNAATIRELTEKLLENPRYGGHRLAKHNFHSLLAQVAIDERDFGEAVSQLENATSVMASLEGLHVSLRILIDGGRPDLGQGFIDLTRAQKPRNPIRRATWERQLEQYERELAPLVNAGTPK